LVIGKGQATDIVSGFQLEQPQVLVRWSISEKQLQDLFRIGQLRRVTNGYYVTRCTSLGGLLHDLGFHFTPSVNGTLAEFELFGNEVSYEEFQSHLEGTFGPPTDTSPGTEGVPSHVWRIKDVQIAHRVQEHFGPAEYLRIERIKPSS
jgi:hypothetical protein